MKSSGMFLLLAAALAGVSISASHNVSASEPAAPRNALAGEASPYLLQHADDPVDWLPWGPAALEKARRENKLIFLSIGYAACHWCHVMERDNYENPAAAALLNAHFVPIMVDREERPDLDSHFMEMLTALTGQGGWPLNLILTPDLKPVHGGTYFPPEPRFGRPGFPQILTTIAGRWRDDPALFQRQADGLHQRLREIIAAEAAIAGLAPPPQVDYPALAAAFWLKRFDRIAGGFGFQPKFPQTPVLSLFLRMAAASGARGDAAAGEQDLSDAAASGARDDPYRQAALMTLDQMAAGGIRDHLGGGFHRYAVDRYWMTPHFEIMLADNALLARLYLEAYQLTGAARPARGARGALDFLLRRFRQPDGCFASAADADSEGEEGRFYTWTPEEAESAVGPESAAPFIDHYLDPFEGRLAERLIVRFRGESESLPAIEEQLAPVMARLREVRLERPHPALDDKIVTASNALTISALAQAGAVLEEPRYLAAATVCLESLWENSRRDGRPIHVRAHGVAGPRVFLDDYAFVLQALLDLYEGVFDPGLLARASALAQEMIDRFQPAPGALFQLTPTEAESLVPARTELSDIRAPSGNAVAVTSLRRLALLTADQALEETASGILAGQGARLMARPGETPALMRAFDFAPERAQEVVIAGAPQHPETLALLRTARGHFRPGRVLALADPAREADNQAWVLLRNRALLNGRPTAYVCHNLVCRRPVNDPEALAEELNRPPPPVGEGSLVPPP